jgi:hypothetical protein
LNTIFFAASYRCASTDAMNGFHLFIATAPMLSIYSFVSFPRNSPRLLCLRSSATYGTPAALQIVDQCQIVMSLAERLLVHPDTPRGTLIEVPCKAGATRSQC